MYETASQIQKKGKKLVTTFKSAEVLEEVFKKKVFPNRFVKYYCLEKILQKFTF